MWNSERRSTACLTFPSLSSDIPTSIGQSNVSTRSQGQDARSSMTIPTLRNRLDSLRLPNEVVALLLALQVRDPDLSQLARLSDEDWRTLLAFCNLANLALPLARLPSQEFP